MILIMNSLWFQDCFDVNFEDQFADSPSFCKNSSTGWAFIMAFTDRTSYLWDHKINFTNFSNKKSYDIGQPSQEGLPSKKTGQIKRFIILNIC